MVRRRRGRENWLDRTVLLSCPPKFNFSKAMFVSGEMDIWKIFYTKAHVWVHMKIQSNLKSFLVHRKITPADS